MSLLEIKQLSLSFGGLKAVDSLTISIESGEIFGLIGPNGAGKTTVFNCLSRFYTPDTGSITFDGRDMLRLSPSQVIGAGLARTFQNVELFKNMSVLDNLLVGQHYFIKEGVLDDAFFTTRCRHEEERINNKAQEVLRFLSIEDIKDELVTNLPYGKQKMVEMARALVADPKMIMLDEPAAGMNPSETRDLSALIKKLRDEIHLTILLVEHDMSLVMDICDRLCVLNFGKKIAEGVPAEVSSNKEVIEAYLGGEEDA